MATYFWKDRFSWLYAKQFSVKSVAPDPIRDFYKYWQSLCIAGHLKSCKFCFEKWQSNDEGICRKCGKPFDRVFRISTSTLFSKRAQIFELSEHLFGDLKRVENLVQIYDSAAHGFSLQTLLRRLQSSSTGSPLSRLASPTILFVQTTDGDHFGIASSRPPKMEDCGDEELPDSGFKIIAFSKCKSKEESSSSFIIFHPTKNAFVVTPSVSQWFSVDKKVGLSAGGKFGHAVLSLDADLLSGTSWPNLQFGEHSTLAKKNNFSVSSVNVWAPVSAITANKRIPEKFLKNLKYIGDDEESSESENQDINEEEAKHQQASFMEEFSSRSPTKLMRDGKILLPFFKPVDMKFDNRGF